MLGGWGCTITIILHILDCYICGLYTVYTKSFPWWRHQMETFSALLAIWAGNSQVTGEFPSQRPVKRSFDVFFDLSLNNRLNKQSWGRWFETPSCSLWRHCYVCVWCSDAAKYPSPIFYRRQQVITQASIVYWWKEISKNGRKPSSMDSTVDIPWYVLFLWWSYLISHITGFRQLLMIY